MDKTLLDDLGKLYQSLNHGDEEYLAEIMEKHGYAHLWISDGGFFGHYTFKHIEELTPEERKYWEEGKERV